MRFPIIPSVFLLLVLMSAGVIVPNAVVLLPERDELSRQLSAQSSLRISISGDVRLRFLPRPQLVITDVTAQHQNDTDQSLRAAIMLVNIAPLDLAQRKINVHGVALINVNASLNLKDGISGLIDQAVNLVHPALQIVNMRLSVKGLNKFNRARKTTIDKLSLAVPSRQAFDDVEIRMEQKRNDGSAARLYLELGALHARRQTIALKFSMASDETLDFSGFVVGNGANWRADGELNLNSGDMIAGLAEAGLPVAFLPTARRVSFSGLVRANAAGVQSESLEVATLDSVFRARLNLQWPQVAGESPQLTGRLATGSVDLDQISFKAKPPAEKPAKLDSLWGAFADGLRVTLRMEATRFDIGGETGQNLLLAFDWQGKKIDVQRVSLDLPFRSLLLASGEVDLSPGAQRFEGSFSTRSTDALAAALWLGDLANLDNGAFIETLDENGLQRVSLVGDVSLSHDRIELNALSGRLGDDVLYGDMRLSLGDEVRGDVDLRFSHLDLDDWRSEDAASQQIQTLDSALLQPVNELLGSWLARPNTKRDLRISLAADNFYSGVTDFGSMRMSANIANQSLKLSQFSLPAFRNLAIKVDGQMNYEAAPPHGFLNISMQGETGIYDLMGERLRGLVPLDLAPPRMVSANIVWQLSGPDDENWPNTDLTGGGTVDNLSVDFSLIGPSRSISIQEVGQKLNIGFHGKASDIASIARLPLTYSDNAIGQIFLDLESQSSNVMKMAAKLVAQDDRLSLIGTVRRGATGRRIDGLASLTLENSMPLFDPRDTKTIWPLKGEAQIVSEAESLSFSGLVANIDTGRITGEGVVNLSATVPKLNGNLAAENLDLSWLLPNVGKAGWSAAPMKWSIFERSDFDVQLRGTGLKLGALNLDEVSARLKLLGGVLEAPKVSGRLLNGSFEADIVAEGGSLNPYFSLQLRLSDISAGLLSNKLYDETLVDAHITANLNLSGRGTSVLSMMRSLEGNLQLNLGAGAMRFVDKQGFIDMVQSPAFEGQAAELLRITDMTTPFQRGVGLMRVRDGQAVDATLDFVFNDVPNKSDARFAGEMDFVSRQILANLTLYPANNDKRAIWQISGSVLDPLVKIDASDFDRLPQAVSPPEAAASSALPN